MLARLLAIIVVCAAALTSALEVIDLSIDGLPHRVFPNVSLGLEQTVDERSCKWKEPALKYTPNRRLQKDTVVDAALQRVQLAVVLAVGGHSDQYYDYGPAGSINGLMTVWDSWLDNFFTQSSNTTSLVLLFDQRDFNKQNYTTSTHTYLDNIVISNMGASPVDCVHFRKREAATLNSVYAHNENQARSAVTDAPARSKPDHTHSRANHGTDKRTNRPGCSNELLLDQGYRVYFIDVADKGSINQKPLVIFAAVHEYPLPEWVDKASEEKLFKTWKPWRLPGRFPTNYAYVKMTNWYSYHMLNLKLLDFFDYGGKLDNDVSFVAPFPEPNLPQRLATKNAMIMCTQKEWYYDDSRVAQGVKDCLTGWIGEEQKTCPGLKLQAGGLADNTFWEANLNATFRAHFLTYWFGLYAAPETRRLARTWNDRHPRGMWDYRWGDQQWWPRPISMFGIGDISKEVDRWDEINTDNGKYVVHKLWPRYGTTKSGEYFKPTGTTRLERDLVYNITSKPMIY